MSIESKYEFIIQKNQGTSEIGYGAYSKVHLGRNRQTQQLVAVKMMEVEFGRMNRCLDTLENEVKVHKTLKHKNIIEFYEYYRTQSHILVIQEYAQNGNLFNLLHKHKQFSEEQAKKFFLQVCQGLQYIHTQGYIYRDLKPENLLLDNMYNIKICDFGSCTKQSIIYDQQPCGTFEYMAPELYFKKPYDYKVDIWGLGILLYELLHGKPPLEAISSNDMYSSLINFNLKFNTNISSEAKDLIKSILQIEPIKRISIDQILNHSWIKVTRQSLKIIQKGISAPKININNTINNLKILKNTEKNQISENEEIPVNNLVFKQIPSFLQSSSNNNSTIQFQQPQQQQIEQSRGTSTTATTNTSVSNSQYEKVRNKLEKFQKKSYLQLDKDYSGNTSYITSNTSYNSIYQQHNNSAQTYSFFNSASKQLSASLKSKFLIASKNEKNKQQNQ